MADRFEIPKECIDGRGELRSARKAFEKFVSTAQATPARSRRRGDGSRRRQDISASDFYAEKNVQARWTMRSRCCRPRI